MNKLVSPIILTLAVALLGCASLERNAYRTVGTTAIAVDAAMNAWGDTVRAGHTTSDQERAVEEVYVQYQASVMVLKDAILVYKQSTTKNDSALQTAINIVAATAADVVALVQQLTGHVSRTATWSRDKKIGGAA